MSKILNYTMVQTRSQTRRLQEKVEEEEVEEEEVDVCITKYTTCGWLLLFDENNNYYVTNREKIEYDDPKYDYTYDLTKFEFKIHGLDTYRLACEYLREKSSGLICCA